MKRIVAAMVLSVISMSVFCQSRTPNSPSSVSPVVRSSPPQRYETPPGLKLRNNGRIMAILGSALFVGGAFVLANADEMYYSYSTSSSGNETAGDPKAVVGLLMMSGGTGLGVSGTIMWSMGGHKYKAYKASQTTSLHIQGAGLSIRHRF